MEKNVMKRPCDLPQSPGGDRAEKDTKKLTALYEQGYAYAKEKLDQIMNFLEIKQQAMGGFNEEAKKLFSDMACVDRYCCVATNCGISDS